MKKISLVSVFAMCTMLLSSCELIGGIFKAGIWVGVLVVVAIIAVVVWLIAKVL